MVEITERQWKQFCEGMRREIIGPFVQQNIIEGDNSVRQYIENGAEVARMVVCDHNGTDNPITSRHIFKAQLHLTEAVAFIYIPTDEEYEEWDDRVTLENWDVVGYEIALREGKDVTPDDFKRK